MSTLAVGTVRWPRIVPKDADCAACLKKRTLTEVLEFPGSFARPVGAVYRSGHRAAK